MITLLLGIASLLVLVVLLLAVPLGIAYRIERTRQVGGRVDGEVRFRWLFGLVRFRVTFPSAKQAKPETREDQGKARTGKPQKSKRKKTSTGNGRDMLALLRQPALRQRVKQFVQDLLRATHAHDLFLRLRIGLGDPADTGRLWAFVGPLAAYVATLRTIDVYVEPEFFDPVFEVESHGSFRLIPLQFLALTAAFAISPPIRGAWSTLRKGNA